MPIDRAPQMLTDFIPPPMSRPMEVRPERDSIFGNTYNGVPNPMVPHRHPYPTRFHGPVFKYPMPSWGYEVSPYARAPFAGSAKDDELFEIGKKLVLWGAIGTVLAGGLLYLLVRTER